MPTFVEPVATGALTEARPTTSIRATRIALELDNKTSWEQWTALGVRISVQADASSWWLGDWLVFGESHYAGRYADAVASTGLEYKTLRNYSVVARRFAMSRRRDHLSFAHHAEVCALEDAAQDRWLDLAERHRWSKTELRRQIRSEVCEYGTVPARTVRLTVDAEHNERWHQAAAHAGYEFQDWVVQTLNAAASGAITSRRPR